MKMQTHVSVSVWAHAVRIISLLSPKGIAAGTATERQKRKLQVDNKHRFKYLAKNTTKLNRRVS